MVGDLHAPATHPRYMDFIQDVYEEWDCNRVVLIGDVVDHHSISFHDMELDADNVFGESEAAIEQVSVWHALFPKADVCIGNHDERVIRKASTVGIPEVMLRPYSDLWKTPGWNWDYEHVIDDVAYVHGTGLSGERPAYLMAKENNQSTVLGHCHTVGGISWIARPNSKVFGLSVGCGIDPKHPAMRYSRKWVKRPVLGCGVVIDGTPYFEPMDHRNQYKR